jgi:hypothetical protein
MRQKQETDAIFSIVLYEERQKCLGKVFSGEKGFFFLQIDNKYISIPGKASIDGEPATHFRADWMLGSIGYSVWEVRDRILFLKK